MWKCTRCNETGIRNFNMHVCKGKRDLEQMPLDLLREVCLGVLDEDEAWKLTDERIVGASNG